MSEAARSSAFAAVAPVKLMFENEAPNDAEKPRAASKEDSACVSAAAKPIPCETKLRVSGSDMLVKRLTSTVAPLVRSARARSVSWPVESWSVNSSK
jgi:hypothetical protein